MQAWEASIDRGLAARLARPLIQPGVIRMALARRILGGVAALTERLPLLARFGRYRELVATTRMVHAQWLRSMPEAPPTTSPIARPIVHAVPSRTVERSSNATRQPRAAAQAGEIVAATRESRTAVLQEGSHDLVRLADPMVRRSRVGAPLPARPRMAARVEGHGSPPAPLLVAPPARAAAISRGGDPGRSMDPPAGEVGTRAAAASPVLRVKPRAAAPVQPEMITDAAGPVRPPVVAVTRSAPPHGPALLPIVAPFAGPGMSRAGRRLVPTVPARSGDVGLARAGDLPFAHPLPLVPPPLAAPAAMATPPVAPVPRPIAAPHPVAEAAMRSVPPQKIDLHRLAEQVQRILIRQAAHTRARQGLPR